MHLPKIKIGDRLIGNNEPCFVIAEIGINHNGELNLAKKLVDAAIEAGADAVKFQKRNLPEIYKQTILDNPRHGEQGPQALRHDHQPDPGRPSMCAHGQPLRHRIHQAKIHPGS